MLSRTINVDWEFVSDRFLRLHLNDVRRNTSICLVPLCEQLFWMKSNSQNSTADYIQMKYDLGCFREYTPVWTGSQNKASGFACWGYTALMEHDEVKSKLITSRKHDKSNKYVYWYFRESFALVSDDSLSDVLQVLCAAWIWIQAGW